MIQVSIRPTSSLHILQPVIISQRHLYALNIFLKAHMLYYLCFPGWQSRDLDLEIPRTSEINSHMFKDLEINLIPAASIEFDIHLVLVSYDLYTLKRFYYISRGYLTTCIHFFHITPLCRWAFSVEFNIRSRVFLRKWF